MMDPHRFALSLALVVASAIEARAQCALVPDTPPRLTLTSISTPDAAGIATVTGAPGAAPAGSTLLLVTLDTGHFVRSLAAEDGSFTSSLFAPPGTSILIKADPTGCHVQNLFNWNAASVAVFDNAEPLIALPGTVLRVPDAGASTLQFSGAGLTGFPSQQRGVALTGIPPAWTFTGSIDRRELQSGGTLRMTGTVSIRSTALQSAANMYVSAQATLERLSGADGTSTGARNSFSSALLTPTALPIERFDESSDAQANRVAFTRLTPDRAEATVDLTLIFPADVPAGLYRPFVNFFFEGVPLETASSPTLAIVDRAQRDPAPSGVRLPIVRLANPSPPRLVWMLLVDHVSNGTLGIGATEDRNQFGISPRAVTQAATFIVPRTDPKTGELVRYHLEPFAPTIALGDRGTPTNPPLIPFRFPSGSLTVRIVRPDGTVAVVGPAPFVQGRMRGPVDRNGGPLGRNGGHITDMYKLSTMDPRFEVTFAHDGRHTITLEGAVDDIWGNTWRGGGTYEVWVARTLALDTASLPGTPLQVGDVFNAGVTLTPPAAADVEVRFRLAPNSDATRMIERTVRGRANRFGYFGPFGSGISISDPGEYRVDVTASWVDSQGNLWMGSRTWGGVVGPRVSSIIAHGRRGVDDQTSGRSQWFFRTQTGIPMGSSHLSLPFHAGDVSWLQKGDAVNPFLTFQDPSGVIVALLRDRPGFSEPLAVTGEGALLLSRPDGSSVHLDPSKVDVWGYSYRSIQRPLVRVREEISDDSGQAGMYWRFVDPYHLQIGAGNVGDFPNDFKFQYGGAVLRGSAFTAPGYDIYGSLFVLIPDADPRGGSRTFPPFQGNGGGPSGGPLFTLKGRDIDAFAHLTAVRPGTVLEVGEAFALAGALAPTLPGFVTVRIEAPSGRVRSFIVRANKVGYFYNPAHDFVVAEPGIYTVDVTVTYDGTTSAGQLTAPFPTGGILGTGGSRFFVYAVARGSAPLSVTALPSQQTLTGDASFSVTATAPAGMTLTRAHGTGMMPGFVLTSGELTRTTTTLAYTHAAGALAVDFPNLDTNPPADVVTVTLFGSGTDAAGRPASAARILVLHGSDLYNVTPTAAPFATVGVTASGGGRVLTSTGATCAPACQASAATGDTITLTPVANTGNVFAGWTGDPDCSDGVVTLNGNLSCTALFVTGTGRTATAGTVDLNGDGGGDVFTYHSTAGTSGTPGGWAMELGDRAGSFGRATGAWAPGWTLLAGDFNADGLSDLFLYSATTGAWFRALNTGGGSFTYVQGSWTPGWRPYVVDLNADGRSDVFIYNRDTGAWFKCLTTASASEFIYLAGAWSPQWDLTVGDFNADRRADFFLYDATGLWVRATNDGGAGFSYQSDRWSPAWTIVPGDFNGDGRSDLLLYAFTIGQWLIATTTDPGFTYTGGTWAPGWTVHVGDFDANGRIDVFLYSATSGAWVEGLSTGGPDFAYLSGAWAGGWTTALTDFDGDRRADVLLYSATSGQWFQCLTTTPGQFSYGTGTWEPGLSLVATRSVP